jgi:hypothetical protein
MSTEHLLPFVRHKGRPLAEVPSSYLLWALTECKLSSGLRLALGNELRRRNVQAPPQPPPPRIPDCPRCGNTLYECQWQADRTGQKRIRVECRGCHGFITFAPLVSPFVEEADQKASQTPILDVLTRLDALGAELQSDGQSVWLDAAGEGRVPPALLALIRQCSHELAGMLGKRGT